jgi:23S rRNA pseudouridine2605 synthase
MRSRTRQSRAQITLTRALSKFGVASRSTAEQIIRAGRVRINGKPAASPSVWLDPRTDRIDVDGAAIIARRPVYLAMHKPAGYVTTRSDELGRETVYALVPATAGWVFPVGRLDKDTSGLLLLTNDVRWGECITGPAHGIPKTYAVTVDRPISEADAQTIRRGMALDDGTELLPARVRTDVRNPSVAVLSLREGKNRQVRRMMETLGYRVVALVRTAIGPIALGELPEGATRPVTAGERDAVLRLAQQRGEG